MKTNCLLANFFLQLQTMEGSSVDLDTVLTMRFAFINKEKV